MSMIAGIEVDESTFNEYQGKQYDVPGLDDQGSMPLKTVELLANSKQVAEENPDIHEACNNIMKQVRDEIADKLPEDLRWQLSVAKDPGFDKYLKALEPLHQVASEDRAALQHSYEKIVNRAKADETDKTLPEYERTQAKLQRLEAERKYKNDLEELQKKTIEKINDLRDEFEERVKEFYRPDGSKLDPGTVSLLRSGMKLTADELTDMIVQNEGNPSMIRLIDDYCQDHKIENRTIILYAHRARSRGAAELQAFDNVAQQIRKAVGSDDGLAKAWGTKLDNFARLLESNINGLNNQIVKPGKQKYQK